MRLGITRREWTLVLGANLAILLVAYVVALACTLSGSDFFLLNVHSEALESLEATLRGWNVYFLVQLAFAAVEETIILSFVAFRRPRAWWVLGYIALFLAIYLPIALTTHQFPWYATTLIGFSYAIAVAIGEAIKGKEKVWFIVLRLAIATIVSLMLNVGINFMRTSLIDFGSYKPSTEFFYLCFEYNLALALALGFLALFSIREKGGKQCPTLTDAGGSSRSSARSSQKSSDVINALPPAVKRKVKIAKAVTFTIQFVALIAISLFPIFIGKGTEFALMYVSFCITRLILGFNRSLHFESEAVCIISGALVFWGLTVLIPSTEAIIITSVIYGCGLALGFRLWWELHDLRLFRKASKRDRYAMLYCAFDGDLSPENIKGTMRMLGYDEVSIRMVVSYMQGLKVEAIAMDEGFARITVEKRLTEISSDLYDRR